jgi:predicted metallopeptidase
MFAYPDSFIDELKNVVNIVRSGDVMEQKEALVHDAWVVQGYAQKMIVGDPGIVGEVVEQDPLNVLESVAETVDSEEPGKVSAVPIPWTLVFWAIKKLIEKYL